MRLATILGEVLPVLGTIGLLGLWLYQQTAIESRSDELRKLASARTVYQTYQSNNALFNVINELIEIPSKAARLREFQLYNYELGLSAIQKVLPETDTSDIPPAPNAYGSAEDFEAKMKQTQTRLEILQDRLQKRQEHIQDVADAYKQTSLWCYIGLSVMTILGAVCKVIDKFSMLST
jgi:hypothetical protein